MAVKLIANYAKRLGLPGYSSHQFSVSVETELQNVTDVPGESARLYESLQKAVDDQMQQTGFVPPDGYGMNGNGHSHPNGNGQRQEHNGNAGISDKQLDLINRIVRENNANKADVENMAVEFFGGGVRTLSRAQASDLIDELFIKYPGRNGARYGQRRTSQRQPTKS
jgi:hypothetical protein